MLYIRVEATWRARMQKPPACQKAKNPLFRREQRKRASAANMLKNFVLLAARDECEEKYVYIYSYMAVARVYDLFVHV